MRLKFCTSSFTHNDDADATRRPVDATRLDTSGTLTRTSSTTALMSHIVSWALPCAFPAVRAHVDMYVRRGDRQAVSPLILGIHKIDSNLCAL